MAEIFKDIPWYEWQYQASNLGNIKSYDRIHNHPWLEWKTKIYKWKILKKNLDKWYYKVSLCVNWKLRNFRISRLVWCTYLWFDLNNKKLVIDHINRNTLDDSLENIRIATISKNAMNKVKTDTNCSSQYKWVIFAKWAKKWRAQIMLNNKHIHLGYFNNEQDAALSYNKKAIELFWEFAFLNFNLI